MSLSNFSDYNYDQNNPSGDRPHNAQQLQRAQSPPPLCGHGHAHLWQVALKICIHVLFQKLMFVIIVFQPVSNNFFQSLLLCGEGFE